LVRIPEVGVPRAEVTKVTEVRVTPLIVPPVIAMAFESWVAIVPKPRLVLAPRAVVAPVPPWIIGTITPGGNSPV
jgi:hypothetical protein